MNSAVKRKQMKKRPKRRTASPPLILSTGLLTNAMRRSIPRAQSTSILSQISVGYYNWLAKKVISRISAQLALPAECSAEAEAEAMAFILSTELTREHVWSVFTLNAPFSGTFFESVISLTSTRCTKLLSVFSFVVTEEM